MHVNKLTQSCSNLTNSLKFDCGYVIMFNTEIFVSHNSPNQLEQQDYNSWRIHVLHL